MTAAKTKSPEETIPILRVADAAAAVDWYRRLGFRKEWEHRYEPSFPAFVSMTRGDGDAGVRVFLSEHTGDAAPGGLIFLRVSDIDGVAAEFDAEITDLGHRLELHLEDPDGNRVRVGGPANAPRPESEYTIT